MMSMMGVREPGVHIVPQYIHIEGIWQVQLSIHLRSDWAYEFHH